MKKLFFANIDVLGQDAGSVYVGAHSEEEADALLQKARLEHQYCDVSFIGRLQSLPTPYFRDMEDRAFDVLGDTSGLFCCDGEDRISTLTDEAYKEMEIDDLRAAQKLLSSNGHLVDVTIEDGESRIVLDTMMIKTPLKERLAKRVSSLLLGEITLRLRELEGPINQPFKIPAKASTDDQYYSVEFDAYDWFLQADDNELTSLALYEFGGDYPADLALEYFQDRLPEVDKLFSLLRSDIGYECYIDKKASIEWIKEHRAHIYTNPDLRLEEMLRNEEAIELDQTSASQPAEPSASAVRR